jgi:alkylation response protein AidB-like acyl-CoA dehydrogenase
VPASCIIGEENQGWRLITSQLNRERVTLCSSALVERGIEEALAWAKENCRPDGTRVLDVPWVRRNLAEVTAELEFLKLLNWKVAWSVATKHLDVADSSSVKVYGTEFYTRAFRRLMQIYNEVAYLVSDDLESEGRLESLYRGLVILTFGGGTNEMQRDLITMFGMGFPRADR